MLSRRGPPADRPRPDSIQQLCISSRVEVRRASPGVSARRGPNYLRRPALGAVEEWHWDDLSQHVDRLDPSSATPVDVDSDDAYARPLYRGQEPLSLKHPE